MNTNSEHDLNVRLEREADRFFERGGTELDLAQVSARAGEIRRGRRMRATMVMAAAVLAVAVPTAMVALQHDPAAAPGPATPPDRDTSPLVIGGLEQGPAPRDGYAVDGTFRVGDRQIALPTGRGTVTEVAPITGGAMVAVRSEGGDLTARFVDDQGSSSGQTWPMEGGFAVSDGGNVAAFVEPDGTVLAVQDVGSRWFELGKGPTGSGFDAVAVLGENCSGRSEEAGCTVYAVTRGEQPRTYAVVPHDTYGTAIEPRRTVDVAGEKFAAFTSVTDTGSCSDVRSGSQGSLWSTCDHRLLSFSPDGSHVLASSAYADGMGDSELAVLDSDTGKVLLDLRTADQAVLTRVVWEDDSHVLATVFENNAWAVVRLGLDSSRELAVPPVRDSGDLESPFVLSTR
jgi:hypothetical protein